MNRTERIYKIKAMLLDGRPVRMGRMLAALEVSRPTVRRDLDYMRDRLNWPIIWDRDRGGYRVDDSATARYELPGLWLSSAEAHALLTMHYLLARLQPRLLAPHVEPLKTRVEALLETPEQDAGEVMKRVRVLPMGSRRIEPVFFQLLAHALLSRRRIVIRHYNRERNEESERELSPQRLVHYRDNWYLDAWDHGIDALRTFSVEMIRRVEVGERRARDVPDRQLDEELSAGYGIFAGKDHRTAKLRFTPYRARWVQGEIWHSRQKASFDGAYYVLEVPYSDERELMQDILRYGPDVEVLAPKSLRRKVAERLREAAGQYGAI
ncbi:MAG TPA: WYL domain-containing protein [Woeseiaceae bacterium]|nr:WYL domain-containing protein [Woeseiaceae bacterium]